MTLPEKAAGPKCEEPIVRTLWSHDPESILKYNARKKGKVKKKLDPDQFLSGVAEQVGNTFRFEFSVVGALGRQVVGSVCQCDASARLIGKSSMLISQSASSCFCEVTLSSGPQAGSTAVAKLAFNHFRLDEEMPRYNTAKEALGAAIVYVLAIDTTGADGDSDFKEQLEALASSLRGLRAATRARLRPVKAVLFCCAHSASTAPKSSLEQWAVQLADFEQVHGDLWKFGPISLLHGDDLHTTFAEMASARILHAQSGDVRSGSKTTAKPGEDAEDGKDVEEQAGGQITFTPSAGRRRSPSAGSLSDASSSASERERPPIFETEMSGSECSEKAIEYHERIFGVILESPQGGPDEAASPDRPEPKERAILDKERSAPSSSSRAAVMDSASAEEANRGRHEEKKLKNSSCVFC